MNLINMFSDLQVIAKTVKLQTYEQLTLKMKVNDINDMMEFNNTSAFVRVCQK